MRANGKEIRRLYQSRVELITFLIPGIFKIDAKISLTIAKVFFLYATLIWMTRYFDYKRQFPSLETKCLFAVACNIDARMRLYMYFACYDT